MVQKELAKKFGGTTTFHTEGSWVDDEGDLVEEGVEVVTAWYSSNEYVYGTAFVVDLAVRVREKANQDCVAIEVEGEMILV